MSTTTKTNPIDSTIRAGVGRRAAVAFSVTGPTTVARAVDDGMTVELVCDTIPGTPDGETGEATPLVSMDGTTASAWMSGRDFRRIVAGILPATDTESSRFALGGTLVELAEGSMVTAVGTDGRRMHVGHLQPSGVCGQAAAIVRAEQWELFSATARAAVRRILGLSGRRLDAAVDRGAVTITIGRHVPTGGEVVRLDWSSNGSDGRVLVKTVALSVAGRFPRWRDILEQLPNGVGMPIDPAAVAGAVAEFRAVHKAAEKAGRDAWMAETLPPRARARKPGEYRHDRGVIVSPVGMEGRGCQWSSAVPTCPTRTCINPAFLADAVAGAAAWGGEVTMRSGEVNEPIAVSTGAEHGPRFLAIIMPMAID